MSPLPYFMRCTLNNCKQWRHRATVLTNLSAVCRANNIETGYRYILWNVFIISGKVWKKWKDAANLFVLACGWVWWIQLTLQKLLSILSLFDFIYLFNVCLLEAIEYCLDIICSRTKRWHGKIIWKSAAPADKHWKVCQVLLRIRRWLVLCLYFVANGWPFKQQSVAVIWNS